MSVATPVDSQVEAPSLPLLLAEARVLVEWADFRLRLDLSRLPRGDGHGVLVVPGFGAGDFETGPLRRALAALGYEVRGLGAGRNLGMRPPLRTALGEQLASLYERHGPVSLIGWSLGGVFVRELARRQPDKVRAVYTLGSPITGNPEANNMMPLFRLANRGASPKPDPEAEARRRLPPPVRCVAVYSRRDGIVAWPCSREPEAPNTENIEVPGSHFGLVCNRHVVQVLATRLAENPLRQAK